MAVSSGGGWHAIGYTLKKALTSGSVRGFLRSLRSRNACKTCALGMGGQRGGMVNEQGHFPEFCKKSVQALAADMQPAVPVEHLSSAGFDFLSGMGPRQLEALGRLTVPLVAGPQGTGYRPTTWEEAIKAIGGALKQTRPQDNVFYVSGRSSNEAGFLIQLFARAYGTNNVNNCSFYCHQASGAGLGQVFGGGTGSVDLDDLDLADLVFVIGANPASNHPRFMRVLMEVRRRGGKVVVINPLREVGLMRFKVPSDVRSMLFGSEIADLYVQPAIGGDIAFLSAVARMVIDRQAIDRDYLEAHTTGSEALLRHLASLDPDDLILRSGVDKSIVAAVADLYCASKASIFTWAMGITHHLHGVDNVRMIADLALLRGMCGRPGAGMLPLRGHSNIQGMGTVGVTPKLKTEFLSRLEGALGIPMPVEPGWDTMTSMQRAEAGGVRTAICLGGNLYGSNPDTAFAGRALGAIDNVVYLSTSLNTGHIHGRGKTTWILPVAARDEEPQPTTQESMFSYIRLSDGGAARHQGPLSEIRVISGLADAVMGSAGPIDWKGLGESTAAIRALISRVVPGLGQLADIDRTKGEFTIPGRIVRTPVFATPDGKAHLQVVAIPDHGTLDSDQLRLMTVRSEGQFNTVVFEDHDRYRGQDRRDVIMMHPSDRLRLGLTVDQRVAVESSTGILTGILVREVDIAPGSAAMYYPEANILVDTAVDPASGTPSFKNTVVRILSGEAVARARN